MWDNYPVDQSDSRVCTAAAGGGHFHCLTWLKYRGFASDLTTCCAAALSGSPEAVVYLIESGCTTRDEGMIPLLHFAAKSGSIATLECVVEKFEYEPDFNDTIARGAIEGSQLHILDWVRENNFYSRVEMPLPMPFWCLTLWRQAAYVGDLRILEWGWTFARSFDTPDPECTSVAAWAILGGNMCSLRWLLGKGFPLGSDAWKLAVHGHKYDMVIFLRSVRCPGSS